MNSCSFQTSLAHGVVLNASHFCLHRESLKNDWASRYIRYLTLWHCSELAVVTALFTISCGIYRLVTPLGKKHSY